MLLRSLKKLFDALEESLAVEPCLRGSVSEPWPGNFGRPGWNLRKLKFTMPGLKGASGLGRLLYIVDELRKKICLLWIYTPQEFSKQPPAKDLKEAVKEMVRYLDD